MMLGEWAPANDIHQRSHSYLLALRAGVQGLRYQVTSMAKFRPTSFNLFLNTCPTEVLMTL